ncbi:MAG: MBL fold metallo-hydrolase, partial [Bacteroidales bacterium]|nr:MBL fold metallo-hydrolase [Bacteroidales bacterium]
MQVTFLGTGTSSGVPMIGCQCRVCQSPDPKDKRLRASVLVEIQPDPVSSAVAPPLSQVILIDAGPDFRQQMLTYQVHRLDAILLTHEHKDHVAGLDDVRA